MAETRPPARIELAWSGGEAFSAKSSSGVESALDGEAKQGFSPTQALLASLGACMGIDLVLILQKMRLPLERLEISAAGDRQEEPPRFFRRVELRFTVTGDVDRERAEHALELSRARYCSVLHSLRRDLELDCSLEIVTPPEGSPRDRSSKHAARGDSSRRKPPRAG